MSVKIISAGIESIVEEIYKKIDGVGYLHINHSYCKAKQIPSNSFVFLNCSFCF